MNKKFKVIIICVLVVAAIGFAFYNGIVKEIIERGDIKESFKIFIWVAVSFMAFVALLIGGIHLYEFLDKKGYGIVFKICAAVLVVAAFLWIVSSEKDRGKITCVLCEKKFVYDWDSAAQVYSGEKICNDCLFSHIVGRCNNCGIYIIHEEELIGRCCPSCHE